MMNNQSLEDELLGVKNLLDIRLSYSRVSDFDRNGPKALKERTFVTNDGAKMGGLIDDMLFTPDEVEKKYYLFSAQKPTATLAKVCDIITEQYAELPDDIDGVALAIISNNEFWGNIKNPDTLIKKFAVPEFYDYLNAFYESKNKTIITQEEYDTCEEIVEILKTHKFSKDVVAYPKKHESKYAQFEINIEYRGFAFKGILDLLVVNHKKKTVQMIDLKTGKNPAEQFGASYIKWRYYLQEAIYQLAFESICEQLKLEGYTLLPFQFLYISRFEKIPLLYTVSEKWSKAAIKGFKLNNYEYRGLDELLDTIKWHWEQKKFDLSKEVYEEEGTLILKDDFIEIDE